MGAQCTVWKHEKRWTIEDLVQNRISRGEIMKESEILGIVHDIAKCLEDFQKKKLVQTEISLEHIIEYGSTMNPYLITNFENIRKLDSSYDYQLTARLRGSDLYQAPEIVKYSA